MSDISKLILSDEEQQLVNNPGWILTKRKIMGKVDHLLGDIAEHQKKIVEKESSWLPAAVSRSTPKIAKGENYLQLPYMLLDYPRCFEEDNIFAVRTMFWWGNFFSITLHVSGTYKEIFQQNISGNLQRTENNFFICINENQWHHHFEADNYFPVKQLSENELPGIIYKKSFIKLAVKFSLQQWSNMNVLLDKSFAEMLELLKA